MFSDNFWRAKNGINEFLIQCRNQVYFNVGDIYYAIMEPNGKITFMPTSMTRPANPNDIKSEPKIEEMQSNIIIDGIINVFKRKKKKRP